MNDNNGFKDALKQINTLINVNEEVSLNALEEAANYYVDKLRPKIPRSNKNKKHLRDGLKVIVLKDMVQVVFEDEFFYWHLVEHGHRAGPTRTRVKGSHFVRNTFTSENNKINEIMTNKIINKMGG